MTDQIKSQNKKIYSAYDQHICCNVFCPPEEDKTKQSFADECDVNLIIERYTKTGILDSGNRVPQYGEAHAFDFQEAQNLIIYAESMFNALPAIVRSKFDNDPHTMLAWMDDPINQEEATSMGLIRAAEVLSEGPTSLKTEVAPTPLKTPVNDLSGNPIPTP